jgi:hypothetical protein
VLFYGSDYDGDNYVAVVVILTEVEVVLFYLYTKLGGQHK